MGCKVKGVSMMQKREIWTCFDALTTWQCFHHFLMAIDVRPQKWTSMLLSWYKKARTGTISKFEHNLVKHRDKVLKRTWTTNQNGPNACPRNGHSSLIYKTSLHHTKSNKCIPFSICQKCTVGEYMAKTSLDRFVENEKEAPFSGMTRPETHRCCNLLLVLLIIIK